MHGSQKRAEKNAFKCGIYGMGNIENSIPIDMLVGLAVYYFQRLYFHVIRSICWFSAQNLWRWMRFNSIKMRELQAFYSHTHSHKKNQQHSF